MGQTTTIEVPIRGMDCDECTRHVQHAIATLPGVASVTVLLASEKAVITLDPAQTDVPAICAAVASAGYEVAPPADSAPAGPNRMSRMSAGYTRQVLTLFGVVIGVVLFVN